MTATEAVAELSADEIRRYSRHLILPEVALEGQQRLKAASVLLVGAGGLGSPLGLYLAAAGVGRIGMVDYDVVELSNLHRQVLYGTSAVGRPKLAAARDRLSDVNPHVELTTHETRLTSENAIGILENYDIVVDGTDNFPTRYLVNDACVLLGKPNVYGSIYQFDGQVSVFGVEGGPCYRCIYREPPPPGLVPSCAEGGVLGVLPGLVGVVQATETIKLILQQGTPLVGRLLLIDALSMTFRTVNVTADPACPACGTREISRLIDYDEFCGVAHDENVPEITPRELATRVSAVDDFDLIDVREPHEWEIARLPSARLIPLGDLAAAHSSLDLGREVVLYCKGGVRSARGVAQLKAAGFAQVWSLAGGITRWSEEVDSTVPVY